MNRLMRELKLLGAANIVMSTNQPIRRDGMPYAAKRNIVDPGAAVYFMLNGRTYCMAQDRYRMLQDNIRSLAISIEGMRQMQRHGGGHMMNRAFEGFAALPTPAPKRPWNEILGFGQRMPITLEAAKLAYRSLANKNHPDKGGSEENMAELNAAYEKAKAYYREKL